MRNRTGCPTRAVKTGVTGSPPTSEFDSASEKSFSRVSSSGVFGSKPLRFHIGSVL
jgi:hypothetical protein